MPLQPIWTLLSTLSPFFWVEATRPCRPPPAWCRPCPAPALTPWALPLCVTEGYFQQLEEFKEEK